MASPASPLHVVLMTCPPDQAEALLIQLLEERLVGCGNILPGARACYWWEGVIQRDAEALVIMETPAERVEALLARAAELHPYEVPKLIALGAAAAHAPYAAWLRAVTTLDDP